MVGDTCLTPDVVYVNGAVITMDERKPQAEAVATWGDRIVAVGSSATVRALSGPHTRVVDLAGRAMLPGLIEPHSHPFYYGARVLLQVNLGSPPLGPVTTMVDLLEALKERARNTPPGQWILGYNYDGGQTGRLHGAGGQPHGCPARDHQGPQR